MTGLSLSSLTADAPTARMRSILLLLLGVVGASYLVLGLWWGSWPAVAPFVNRSGTAAGGDFLAFWASSALAAGGDAAGAYSRRFTDLVASFAPTLGPANPWSYPPTVLLLLRPLGWLAPGPALVLWLVVITGCALATVRVATGSWRLAPWALLFPPAIHAIINGQNGTISALLLATFFVNWRTAPALAGIAAALLANKPHLAIVPVCLALAFAQWRLLAWAAGSGAVLAAAALLVDGWAPWAGFLAQSQGQLALLTGALPLYRLVTPFALLYAAGVPLALALLAHGTIALAVLAATIRIWRRDASPFARALGLALAVVLVPPYAYDYDLAVLLLPAALLLRRDDQPFALGEAATRWLVALAAVPLFGVAIIGGSNVQIGAVAGLLALAIIALPDRWVPKPAAS